jgi:lambda repressor-like predicted transcriptional regulator
MLTDEIREFTIYHCPGWKSKWREVGKVGCTVDFMQRSRQYRRLGYDGPIDILETFRGTAQEASEREFQFADQFGYKRGQNYATQNWSAKLTLEQRSEAGHIGGPIGGALRAKTFTPEHQRRAGEIRGKILRQIGGKRTLTDDGISLIELSKQYNVPYNRLRQRFHRGIRGKGLIDHRTLPPAPKHDIGMPLTKLSRQTGIPIGTLSNRYHRGDRGDRLIRPSKEK